ncbi:MAG: hypothetical protein VKK42_28105 [Lyngbya sp.]|nr:hypothetical protein [Lyngbya sp.]
MQKLSGYWTFVRIRDAGNYVRQKIPQAKVHFDRLLEDIDNEHIAVDNQQRKRIQTQLFHQLQNSPDSTTRWAAEVCLRCYISNAILLSSQYLLKQFSPQCNIKLNEILILVLDDVDITASILNLPAQSYRPFAAKILTSFKPTLSSLETWIRLKVRQNPEVRRLFLEHGILMTTDWALLNQTEPKDLQVLANYGVMTDSEVDHNCVLLECYHQIYRAQWRMSKKKGTCPDPTEEQIQEIAAKFEARFGMSISPNCIFKNLRNLAEKIRTYKIREGGGKTLEDSADHSETLEKIPNPSPEIDEIEERMAFLVKCLDRAIIETIQTRLASLKCRTPDKVSKYPIALKLYFCPEQTEMMTMNDIANRINLKGQYEVTRLLEIKKFCSHVQNRTVEHLKDNVLKCTDVFKNPDCLERVKDAIEQLIERPQKSNLSSCKSLFIQRLNLALEQVLHK